LSRLNRIHPLKQDTFVLDFRNDGDEIAQEFDKYYGLTVAPPTDPNVLYDTRARLDDYDLLRPDEIEATVALLLTISDPKQHGQVYALLDPALERFKALDDENQLGFKDALDKFVRTYAFVSQIVSFSDSKLERDYAYCRALASRLRDQNTVERLDLGSEVELTHLRHEITFEGSLALTADQAEVKSITGDGRGPMTEPDIEPLSKIIDVLNERFGLNLGEADELFFGQIEETFVADDDVMAQARANTFDNFRLAFDPKFLGTVIGRMDENEALFKRMLDDEEFRAAVMEEYAARVYRRARAD
jgi:type I restriction enzyme R subunit